VTLQLTIHNAKPNENYSLGYNMVVPEC
jgi:hypothetical protein